MFKKAILGVAIVLVLAAAGVSVAAASSSSVKASKHQEQTIQLVAKQTGVHPAGAGRARPRPGRQPVPGHR